MGYPVLTFAEDGSTSQARFLAMAETTTTADNAGGQKDEGDTVWPIPARVVWEDAGDGEELVVMLDTTAGVDGGGSGDGRKLMEKVQELQTAGKWFKVRISHAYAR